MKNTIDYDLEYRQDGEAVIFPIHIEFVSNWCIRKYNMLLASIFDVKNKWDEFNNNGSKIAALNFEAKNGYEKEIDKLKENQKILISAIEAYGDEKVEHERFELLKQILSDNGYKNDMFFDYNFWDKQVDPGDINKFLEVVIFKDFDKKKH